MITIKKLAISCGAGLVLMMIMTLGGVTNAFASDGPGPTVDVALGTGGLSTTSGAIHWTTPITTLNGATQDAVYTFPITVDDATGTAAGWNLTITSTTFTGSSHSLPVDASTITGAAITSGTGTAPVASTDSSKITYTNLVLPGASATAVRFFSAQANTGMGTSTITPTVHIAIPADAIAATYSSTITVASVNAP